MIYNGIKRSATGDAEKNFYERWIIIMNVSNAVALRMPSNYVPMSNEEMEYVEGGASYSLYTGLSGWTKISTIVAQVAGFATTGKGLQAASAVCALTANPAGFLAALVTNYLGYACYGLSGAQLVAAGTAAQYMKEDGGFKAADVGILCWNYTTVKRRYA